MVWIAWILYGGTLRSLPKRPSSSSSNIVPALEVPVYSEEVAPRLGVRPEAVPQCRRHFLRVDRCFNTGTKRRGAAAGIEATTPLKTTWIGSRPSALLRFTACKGPEAGASAAPTPCLLPVLLLQGPVHPRLHPVGLGRCRPTGAGRRSWSRTTPGPRCTKAQSDARPVTTQLPFEIGAAVTVPVTRS